MSSWAGPIRDVLTPVVYVAAAFLVTSGGSKLWDPRPAAKALADANLPAGRWLVRILGTVEVGIGLACLIWPSAYAVGALAGMYLAFACFLGYLLVMNPKASSCGCVGKRDVPPNPVHAAFNLVAAVVAVVAALVQVDSSQRFTVSLGLVRGAVFIGGCCVLAYLIYTVVILFPQAFSAYQRPAAERASTHHRETAHERAMRAEEELRAAGVHPGHPSLYPGGSDVEVGV